MSFSINGTVWSCHITCTILFIYSWLPFHDFTSLNYTIIFFVHFYHFNCYLFIFTFLSYVLFSVRNFFTMCTRKHRNFKTTDNNLKLFYFDHIVFNFVALTQTYILSLNRLTWFLRKIYSNLILICLKCKVKFNHEYKISLVRLKYT
jgi:hypothetical protein